MSELEKTVFLMLENDFDLFNKALKNYDIGLMKDSLELAKEDLTNYSKYFESTSLIHTLKYLGFQLKYLESKELFESYHDQK